MRRHPARPVAYGDSVMAESAPVTVDLPGKRKEDGPLVTQRFIFFGEYQTS